MPLDSLISSCYFYWYLSTFKLLLEVAGTSSAAVVAIASETLQGRDVFEAFWLCCLFAAISDCEKALQWHQALDLIAMMRKALVVLYVITHSAAFNACGKSQQWHLALGLLAALQKAAFLCPV